MKKNDSRVSGQVNIYFLHLNKGFRADLDTKLLEEPRKNPKPVRIAERIDAEATGKVVPLD